MSGRGRTPTARVEDGAFIQRALELASRGLGRTSPNPPVGAVVVRDGVVVGEGWHRRAGGPHAEVVALRAAGEAANGATLYCTLEPCTVVGRTPACAPLVRDAGLRRVVTASVDPNPAVRGRGHRLLRRAGIEVVTGVERARGDELISFFRKHQETQTPFVRLKLASSLDGRIATRTGASRWITGPLARARVHEWRDHCDAVLVGSGTARADDPLLTCRRARGRDPLRIVVDSMLRLPPTARMLAEGSGGVLIATTNRAPQTRECRLAAAGAEVIRVPGRGKRVSLAGLLTHLGIRGILSVLVEGGGVIAAEFLRQGLVDELAVFQAPLLVGGDGMTMIDGLGTRNMSDAWSLADPRYERVGEDWLVRGRPQRRGEK